MESSPHYFKNFDHFSLHLFTSRFELEIEVLVKAAWQGVNVINLPVRVLYDPSERVTHFRLFVDVIRITLLNTYFVIFGLLFIVPRNLKREFQQLFSPPDKLKKIRSDLPIEQQSK